MKKEKEIPKGFEIATFAGGCFWCLESAFESLEGIEAINGYVGEEENPIDRQEGSETSNQVEAIQIYYDPKKYTYKQLLKTFWTQIDPTDDGGQFADRGVQYRTAIFYHDEEQKRLAEESIKDIEESKRFDKPIVTRIVPFTNFIKAEEYHQDYHKKNSFKYKFYRSRSGRDDFIEDKWKGYLEENLTPLQYSVAVKGGTEEAFNNEYHDEKREGIYVDIITGEPLFSSKDKYDSGTGWPSFTRPINDSNIQLKKDFKLIMPRTEVKTETTHLGHVFNDGPKEEGGKRYCLNSASLRFIPKEDMEKEGYREYLKLFDES